MIEAVIFDLDGVICHTDRFHYLAWQAVANWLGIHFDEQLNAKLRGVSRMDSLEILLQQSGTILSQEEKEQLAEEKNQIYRSYLDQMTPADLEPETLRTLNALREMGLWLAIGSSSRNTALILQRLGLDHFFDAVADGTRIKRAKPDPEVFLLAASLLSISASHALVVEDAPAGIQAAKAGGFPSAGLGDAVKGSEADFAISVLSDLCPICSALLLN